VSSSPFLRKENKKEKKERRLVILEGMSAIRVELALSKDLGRYSFRANRAEEKRDDWTVKERKSTHFFFFPCQNRIRIQISNTFSNPSI
jgi:hypothetical protein